MVRNSKALGFGNRMLELLDLCVIELFHDATVQAYQMVMVLALIEFVNRFATFKMAACSNWVSTRYTVARLTSDRSSSKWRKTSSAVMWRCAPR